MSDTHRPLLAGLFPQPEYDRWRAEVERGLKGADFAQRLITKTLEGVEVQPLYTARDRARPDAFGFAGAPPYVRGAAATGRHGPAWDMRPRFDNPDPQALAREISADLARGAHSLWLAFDRQVREGHALPEAPRGAAERGVACFGAAQLGAQLAEVPLASIGLSLDAGANAVALAACAFAAARQRGLAPSELSGSLNADPLGALARDGALPGSLESARAQLAALAAYCAEQAPRMRAVTVSVVPHHDAGAHAAQELAYALATGVTYLRWLTDGGVALASACAQLGFRVAVGSDFFMEIAKLRALRLCWSNVVRACGGGAAEQRCAIHATTSSRTKTARDPWVNMLRETCEAFAAAVGGADAITTGGFDRLLGVSDSFGRRIASNTQVILNEEANVTRVADPAGGAFYVEALTERLAQEAWALFQALEAEGGMANALLSGKVAAQIAATAAARDAQIAKRKQPITGVSEFAHVDEAKVERKAPDWAAIDAARRSALSALAEPAAALRPIASAAGAAQVSAAIDAAAQGAGLAAISSALWGLNAAEPARIAPLPLHRDAERFERLRDASDARERAAGKRPSVFLCNIGPIPQHMARAQFASGFFNAGGFAVLSNDGFAAPEAAAEAFATSGAELAAICGSDKAYPEWVARVAPLLRQRGAARVILAGRPGDAEDAYRKAGVTDFIYAGCDVAGTLEQLLGAVGVKP